MKFRTLQQQRRRVWTLDNGCVTLGMLAGGGHICTLLHKDVPGLNPLWTPHWPQIEPWQYTKKNAAQFGNSRLLAGIAGHNPCLAGFGEPSTEEKQADLDCHYEAPVARWHLLSQQVGPQTAGFTTLTVLPVAQMCLARTISTRRGSALLHVKETLANLARHDMPFTMCQHVSFGAPFLEKGVTLFDMPATKGHTFPDAFGRVQRLQRDTAFTWPNGPGVKGPVDLRMIAKQQRVSSDFTTQLMDPRQEYAWFSAVHPARGLLLAYVWRRADYPWIGNWEENFCRLQLPWAGKELVRGMEFANTPFPTSVRNAVDRGTFHGERTYRWLPARGTLTFEYWIVLQPVTPDCRGVRTITMNGGAPILQLKTEN
ncbi:MAG: hypothetical protein NTV22_13925 [bacterium]|nr:hypothetical protein [bacterium]